MATVSDMAGLKRRPLGEFNRQILMAQYGVEWLKRFSDGPITPGTRVDELFLGTEKEINVHKWAQQFKPENK